MLKSQTPIPVFTFESIEDYVMEGTPPGGFLYAVLTNDLSGAFRQADSSNRAAVGTIHDWLFNYAPAECWDGDEKVEAWIEDDGFRGRHPEGNAEAVRERFERYRKEHYATA